MAMIPDCFVSRVLKEHVGHGEAKLYIGCKPEDRFILTSKPLIVKYSQEYLNNVNNSKHSKIILDNIKKFEDKYSSTLIAYPRCIQDKRRMYIGGKDKKDLSWKLFRETLLSYKSCILFEEKETNIDVTIKPSSYFVSDTPIGYSIACIEWLKYLEKTEGITIRNALNGGEFSIKTSKGYRYPVDGYCEQTNTVYEFQGDYWHGNPAIYKEDDMIHGIPYSEKWKKDALKKKTFEELGYKVVTMWESDYYKFKKELNRNIRENV